jgi:hypothetical protein
VRQYSSLLYTFINLGLLTAAIEHPAPSEAMGQALTSFLASRRAGAQGQARDSEVTSPVAFFIDGTVSCLGNIDQAAAAAERQRLAGLPGTATGDGGTWVYDGRNLLVQAAAGPTTAETGLLVMDVGTPGTRPVQVFSALLRTLGALAQRSAAGGHATAPASG